MTVEEFPFKELPRLSYRDLQDRGLASMHALATIGSHALVDQWVAGVLGLARGTVFVNADVSDPFVFVGTANGHRCHVVVAREYGDITWPAYMKRERAAARGRATAIVREGMRDVTDAIYASKARLTNIGANP